MLNAKLFAHEAGSLARAQLIYAARRRRDVAFPSASELFHDPAWDILLYLFIAGEKNRIVFTTEACIGSAAPTTTGIRLLNKLRKRELIVSETDSLDRRKTSWRLSEMGQTQVKLFLLSL